MRWLETGKVALRMKVVRTVLCAVFWEGAMPASQLPIAPLPEPHRGFAFGGASLGADHFTSC